MSSRAIQRTFASEHVLTGKSTVTRQRIGSADGGDISAIYSSLVCADPSKNLVGVLRELLKASSLTINVGSRGNIQNSRYIVDAEWDFQRDLERYKSRYSNMHPIIPSRMRTGKVYDLSHWISPGLLEDTRLWREFCEPLAVEDAVFCDLGRAGMATVWLTASRRGGRGVFTQQERLRIECLASDIFNAVCVAQKVDNLVFERSIHQQIWKRLGYQYIALDNSGHIVDGAECDYFNSSDQNHANDDLLSTLRNMIETLKKAAGRLDVAYETMTEGAASLAITMWPFENVEGSLHNPCAFVACIRDRNNGIPAQIADHLVNKHGLTPAEARFAVFLAEGKDLEEISSDLRITRQTAKTYCKRVLSKTGLHRQAELVRMILSS